MREDLSANADPLLRYYSSFDMDEVKKLRERIKKLQMQRADELEGRLLLSSCPTWKNSFGRFPYAEKSE